MIEADVLPQVLRSGMTMNSDELVSALQENLKLRRELATEMVEAYGEKLACCGSLSTGNVNQRVPV